jgi:hypothetical protein
MNERTQDALRDWRGASRAVERAKQELAIAELTQTMTRRAAREADETAAQARIVKEAASGAEMFARAAAETAQLASQQADAVVATAREKLVHAQEAERASAARYHEIEASAHERHRDARLGLVPAATDPMEAAS